MDADELFLGPHHKFLKEINLSKYNVENDDSCFKCNVDEVNKLLSIKKLLLEQPRYEKCVSLSEAEWDDDLKLAKVTKIAKNLTKNFSHSRNKSIYLYPEECLCLLEMKCLILKWNEKQISIKNAYTLLLAPENNCTFNQFRTYGYLVKLGFRVFKYDSKLKNDNYDPKNLTKLPEISAKKKKSNINNFKIKNKTDISYCNRNIAPFPKLESSGWVVISRQPSIYLPLNVQPNYDVYSFNITIKSNSTIITEIIAFYETIDFKKIPFCPVESEVYESPLPTGKYPVYEKNILKIIKSENENNYEPQVKRFKQTKVEEDPISAVALPRSDKNNIRVINGKTNLINIECDHYMDHTESYGDNEKFDLPINMNKEITTSSENQTVLSLNKINLFEKAHLDFNKKENIVVVEDNISLTINKAASTSNYEDNIFISKDKINSTSKIHGNSNIEDTITDSIPFVNFTNYSEQNSGNHESTISNIIPEYTAFEVQLNLPNHIRQKLFAIKPTTVHDTKESANNKYHIHYDVYYPDNEVAKTLRPAPDFRVIVFEEDLNSFPDIYTANTSNPIDNVTTLWAIVNSSSVSFYNVNNIILPKSTDWDLNIKKT